MMKRFTLTMMGLLLLLGGAKATPENLNTSGGQNVNCSQQSGYTEVKFGHNTFNGKWNGYYGNDWVAPYTEGTIHRFVFTFNTPVSSDLTLHFVVTTIEDWNNDEQKKLIDVIIPEGASSFQKDIEQEYGHIQLTNTGTQDAKLQVTSITREILASTAVNAPTITAPSTYDGDATVTITANANTHHVNWTISENDVQFDSGTFTTAESPFEYNVTGKTGTIKVTATAYNEDESESADAAEKTITYSIPSGQSSTTSGLPHTFNSWDGGNSITFNNSFFSSIETGDYVVFDVANVAQDGTVLGFRDSWNESPYSGCTTTSGGNGAKGTLNIGDTQWWMKVNSDVVNSLKNHEVRMQGGMVPRETAGTEKDVTSSVDLTSIKVYKSKGVSESLDNSLTKINDVVVELTRSFVADTWNTVCLPFVPTSDQAVELFGSGYQLAAYTGVSGTTMHFTTITIAEFEAGKPYLVLPETGCATGTTVLFDVDITAKTPQTVTHDGYSFVGNFTQKTFTSSDYATSRFVATGNELVTPNENSTLKSLRCYFTVPVAAARSLTFDIDEEGGTTSINTVQGSGVMVNGYYNLNGQRVAKPTKGLFIVNGKKVVIK